MRVKTKIEISQSCGVQIQNQAPPVLGIGGGIDERFSVAKLSVGAKFTSPVSRTGVGEVFFFYTDPRDRWRLVFENPFNESLFR